MAWGLSLPRRPAALSLLGEDLFGLRRGGLADSPEKMKILPENETHTRVSARARRWQKETMVIPTRFRPSSSLLHARRTRDGDLAGRRPVRRGLAQTSPCSSCSLGCWNGLVTVLAQTLSCAILYRRGLRAGARCGLIPHGSTALHFLATTVSTAARLLIRSCFLLASFSKSSLVMQAKNRRCSSSAEARSLSANSDNGISNAAH